jgi:UDP-arabinose 4-epimerase
MRVLVTGGAGYIGSHTAKVLARAGFEPIVFDNLSAGHREAVRWGRLIEGDLADTDLLKTTLARHQIEAVLHFAARAYVGESMQVPHEYFRHNVTYSLNLLDAMREVGVRRIVFSSSCAVYGVPTSLPITESHPANPVNPYGESKLFISRALRWYGEAYGLQWTALRYFNAAGADPEGEIGEHHDPETHLIPLAIQAALGETGPLSLYGIDHPTEDGTAIRDYVHVMDLAEAHVLALRDVLSGGDGGLINLGTGRGHSVRQVIDTVERVTGRSVPVQFADRRRGDPPVLVADNQLAQRRLGWVPRYPSLESMVETAWCWHATRSRAATLRERVGS